VTAVLDRPAGPIGPVGPVDAAEKADGATCVDAPRVRSAPRDGFLDTVRAIALIRVIVWHTLAAVAISWFVASMPAMFFVAGSLLARSLDRRPWRQLLRTRLRRLLLPFWTFGAVVLVVLVVVARLAPGPDTALSPLSLLAWLLPLADPHGSAWEAGWATTPLWYLRCYLWLLLLSPLLRRAHRRWGLRVLLVPIVGIFAVDQLMRHPEMAPAAVDAVTYYVGDLACFSFFWLLGFSHSDGALAGLDRRARLEWAVIGGVAALVWVRFVQPADLVVNNHYPLLLFVGIAWLAVFLAVESWIGRATGHRLLGPVVAWMGRRSITIYLWHPIAIVGAYWLRATFAPSLPRPLVLVLVFPLVLVLTVLFGRVEDFSAGRPAQWWPGRDDGPRVRRIGDALGRHLPRRLSPVTALVVGGIVGALVLGVMVPPGAATGTAGTGAAATAAAGSTGTLGADADLALPPAPSAKPDRADFGGTGNAAAPGVSPADSAADPVTPPAAPAAAAAADTDVAALTAELRSVTDAWRTTKVVDGVELGVLLPDGRTVTLTSGTGTGGSALDLAQDFPITSITKTMTASIILQLVADGKLGLDDPLPEIAAVPGLAYAGTVTIRQILNHTAGIKPYDQSTAYQAAKAGPLTGATALALIRDEPLEWTPGSQVGYSNSGYLTLGLLAEQITGESYEDLLQHRIFDVAGMDDSALDTTPSAGWAGFSAGGVTSTIDDLLSYGDALYRKDAILTADSLATMIDVENPFNTGLGAFPYCPCDTVDGKKVYSSIGHNGGSATVQWAPAQDVVIAVELTESLFTEDLEQADVAELLTAVESAVGA
jgi:CubicO group peptidase (beta-lactamase class C family)/peptidoglycan/LPS O-acetylase OafA/YrhL